MPVHPNLVNTGHVVGTFCLEDDCYLPRGHWQAFVLVEAESALRMRVQERAAVDHSFSGHRSPALNGYRRA